MTQVPDPKTHHSVLGTHPLLVVRFLEIFKVRFWAGLGAGDRPVRKCASTASVFAGGRYRSFSAMAWAVSVLILVFAEAVTVVGPAYPPNAVAGGSVVAALHVAAGSVKSIDILQADRPFEQPVRSAVAGWRFRDSDNGDILVVVDFRTPNLYSTGSAEKNLASAGATPGLAYPKKIVEPPYPPNSLAEGSVVLHLDLAGNGSVLRVKILQGLGTLTGACVAAVRSWQFVPARTKKGMTASSEAYAVFVIRRPILPPRLPE